MAPPNEQGWGENRGENHSGDDRDHGGWGNDRDGNGSGRDRDHGGHHDHNHDHDHDHHHHHDHDGAPCYCRGTLILTERGEVKVEDLAIGDMVVTISGEAKPIKWIGRRSYAGRFIAGNREALPIVVRAGALAPEMPVRDLWLSPGHALLIDGVLVHAEHLVNGLTILQASAVDQVEYFHLEFEAHEVILAEGVPAESYVECNNRQGFHNAHEFAALYPDDTRASFGYCRPRLEAGVAELAAIRAQLFERAAALGHMTTPDPDLHLLVDGTAVRAQSAADGVYTFRLDAAGDDVWLASRCAVPAEMEPLSSDRRSLGVCVQQLVLRDDHLRVEVSHSHPSLCEGFHADEENVRRWTTGMGRIPERLLRVFAGSFIIEVHCLPPMQGYPLNPLIPTFAEPLAQSTPSPRPAALSHSCPSLISSKRKGNLSGSRKRSRRQVLAAAV